MVQIINDPYSGNIAGRFGRGIGQGLSEQLPQEIERLRLASGLRKLNQKNIKDPLEYFTQAVSLPGITPQIVESLGQLAQRKLQGEALKNFGQQPREPVSFPGQRPQAATEGAPTEAPSITTRAPVQATIEPFIPRSPEQILADAAKSYEENPAYFKHDPERAVAFENNKDAQEIARSEALQKQRRSQQDVQNVIKEDLQSQHQRLGGLVPSEVYDRVENKAINAVKSIEDGGEGLTEQQAIKKYGNELNDIAKDYSQLRNLGMLNQFRTGAKESIRTLKEIQKSVAKRDEEEFFAKQLMSVNNLSPNYAYQLAYPLSNSPKLDNYFKDLANGPELWGKKPLPPKEKRKNPEVVFEDVAKLIDRKTSPITLSNELEKKGYSSQDFIKFLTENQEKYLTGEQTRHLKEALNSFPTLNDVYLREILK